MAFGRTLIVTSSVLIVNAIVTVATLRTLESREPARLPSAGLDSRNPASAAKLGELGGELARLNGALEELREQQALFNRTEPSLAPDAEAQHDENDSVVQPDLAAEEVVDPVQNLEQALEFEEPDPDWADWARDEIVRTITDREVEGLMSLKHSECGTTLCRLDFEVTPEHRRAALHELPYLLPWDASGYLDVDPNDPGRAVLYVNRD